ncbi:pectate lyase [Pedobacter petrophilus]|uniref:Pectate lyase n=2 Tax=Pedobacter petrophilus TaxID=1908241 RepID=A0A7K0FZU8_9SPHI|nr:pectate lyase [Pedobacter petrophilus]
MSFSMLSCKKTTQSDSENTAVTTEDTSTKTNAVTEAVCASIGWASQNGGTTGGGNAAPTEVSTYDALRAAIQNTNVKVIQVNGIINFPLGGRIPFQNQTGKTIFGSNGAKLVSSDQSKENSGLIYLRSCKNIVIRNLIFDGPGAFDTDGQDNFTIDGCTNLWIDHCEFRDGVDGNLDFRNASDFVTVSYCKFTYLKAPKTGGPGGVADHRFSDLIGSSDTVFADRGHYRITFVRCWWAQGCVSRMPRVRFGKIHLLNNLFNSTVSKSCVQAGFEADILVESNLFENVKNPIDLLDFSATAVSLVTNLMPGVTGTTTGINPGRVFTPPYILKKIAAANVKATITASNGAGATLAGNSCSTL